MACYNGLGPGIKSLSKPSNIYSEVLGENNTYDMDVAPFGGTKKMRVMMLLGLVYRGWRGVEVGDRSG